MVFWVDDLAPFPKVGYVSSLEGMSFFPFWTKSILTKKRCLRGRPFFWLRGLCLFSEVAAEVAEISSTPWSTGFCRKSSWDPWAIFATENIHMGVSWNGGTPKHHKMIIFSRKSHGFVGETHHFRKSKAGVYPLPWFPSKVAKYFYI